MDELCRKPGDVPDYLRRFNSRKARAIKELDSKEKIKDFILKELLENEDPYGLINIKYGMSGDGYESLYFDLVKLSKTETDPIKRGFITGIVSRWKEAALDLVLDPEAYFRTPETGNKGTPSEFVGSMVLSTFFSKDSPLVQEKVYMERIKAAIAREAILKGEIGSNDLRKVEHQEALIPLLYRVGGEMPDEFWEELEKNPEFIETSYSWNLHRKTPRANELLPLLLRKRYERGGGDLKKTSWKMDWTLYTHFEENTAYEKFLNDPKNEFRTTIRVVGEVEAEVPRPYKHLPGPRILVITDYESEGDTANLGYVEIDGGYESKKASVNLKLRSYGSLSPDVGESLLDFAQTFEKFKTKYQQHLNKIKAKDLPSP